MTTKSPNISGFLLIQKVQNEIQSEQVLAHYYLHPHPKLIINQVKYGIPYGVSTHQSKDEVNTHLEQSLFLPNAHQ